MTDSDKRALRDAFGTFATGVTVVTTRQPDGMPRGFTANSFTSVSLDPPLLLICVAKSALSCDVFAEASHFAVNVLSEDQKAVSGLFASQSSEKFDLSDWYEGPAAMPLLNGTLCGFTCARHRLVDAGDHLILIGRVLDHKTTNKQPLGYFRGRYFSIGLEDPLVNAAGAGGHVTIGAIMERDRQILLHQRHDGLYDVPRAPDNENSLNGLAEMLTKAGLSPALDYLYAVYRDSDTGAHGIYYHGTITGPEPANMTYFSLDDLPLNKIARNAERSMLARYRDEFRHGTFGIYQGDEESGLIHHVSERRPSKH